MERRTGWAGSPSVPVTTSLRGSGALPRSMQICQSTPGLAEGQLVAQHAADHLRSHVDGLGDRLRVEFVGAHQEQVGKRYFEAVLLGRDVHRLRYRGGRGERAVVAELFPEDRDGLAVVIDLATALGGRRGDPQLVGHAGGDLDRERILDLLSGVEHLFHRDVGVDGKGLERAQVRAHRVEALDGLRVDDRGRGGCGCGARRGAGAAGCCAHAAPLPASKTPAANAAPASRADRPAIVVFPYLCFMKPSRSDAVWGNVFSALRIAVTNPAWSVVVLN